MQSVVTSYIRFIVWAILCAMNFIIIRDHHLPGFQVSEVNRLIEPKQLGGENPVNFGSNYIDHKYYNERSGQPRLHNIEDFCSKRIVGCTASVR